MAKIAEMRYKTDTVVPFRAKSKNPLRVKNHLPLSGTSGKP